MGETLPRTTHAAAAAMALVALLAGCAAPAPAPTSAATTSPSASGPSAAQVQAGTPAPTPAPGPELSPAQAKAQAQRLAIEAVDQLQNGDEAAAGTTLDKALELDPGNELARKLVEQIKADAEKELGSTSFKYTVQRDDSLSKLAQQFLGDRYRFYILAKYNGIANPSRVAAGQVIRVPGKAPPVSAAAAVPSARTPSDPEPKPAVYAAASPSHDASGLMAKGIALQAAGDLEGAYIAFSEAVRKDPGNRDAAMQRNSARTALIRRYEREAAQAFQRQNLDLAIAKWNRVLELDPAHPKARLERERALDLNRKMAEKFGSR